MQDCTIILATHRVHIHEPPFLHGPLGNTRKTHPLVNLILQPDLLEPLLELGSVVLALGAWLVGSAAATPSSSTSSAKMCAAAISRSRVASPSSAAAIGELAASHEWWWWWRASTMWQTRHYLSRSPEVTPLSAVTDSWSCDFRVVTLAHAHLPVCFPFDGVSTSCGSMHDGIKTPQRL